MKKSLLLIICIFLFFYSFNVYAADKTTFNVSSVGGSAGNEVTISVDMNNNPKFQTLSFRIPLNSLYVEYKSCSISGFKNASMKNCGINPRHEVYFYSMLVSENDKDYFNDTGNIFNIKLKVKDNVKEDVPINLEVTDYFTAKGDLEYEVVNGIIKVTGDIESTNVNSNENLSDKVDENVTWDSSNKDVAEVDSKGNVSFREEGNTTITAKDKNGKTVYEKTYLVNKKDNKPIYKYIIIVCGILVGVGIIGFIIIMIIKFIKKKKKKINNNFIDFLD